jgi:hypothetical protein
MDLLRFKFRPQVECEMRCAQSQDLRAASPINLTGLEPAILFFFPLTVGLQTLLPPLKKPTRLQLPVYRWPDLSVARQVPVS